jgi:hypothetical protein
VQQFREEQKSDLYVHWRDGYLADYPEVKVEAEYRFFPKDPYFLVWSRMTVEKPLTVTLLRNNEMTMDQFFTHVAWPARAGRPHIHDEIRRQHDSIPRTRSIEPLHRFRPRVRQ